MSMNIWLKVKVKDDFEENFDRGVAHIDPEIVKESDLKFGDVIEIYHPKTHKKTAALLFWAKLENNRSQALRLYSSLRRNIGANVDDVVEIRKIEPSLAQQVSFAGLNEAINLKNAQLLSEKLERRIITKGDILSFYSNDQRIDLVVINHTPETSAVKIDRTTKIFCQKQKYFE